MTASPDIPGDDGNAIIEFLAVALVLLLPLIYLVLAVFEVERNVFAVKQAAREAGRAIATAGDLDTGLARAQYAADLALTDQALPAGGERVAYAPVGVSCAAAGADAATLRPGSDFVVCVTRSVGVPGVGGLLRSHGVTVTGRCVVHIDQFRARSAAGSHEG
ncbi:MAG: hypothetical protein NVSMB13_04690 [Mycobacteriales bacterium]